MAFTVDICTFADHGPRDWEMVEALIQRASRWESVHSVSIYLAKPEASGFTHYEMAIRRSYDDVRPFILGCVRRGPGQPLEFHS